MVGGKTRTLYGPIEWYPGNMTDKVDEPYELTKIRTSNVPV